MKNNKGQKSDTKEAIFKKKESNDEVKNRTNFV